MARRTLQENMVEIKCGANHNHIKAVGMKVNTVRRRYQDLYNIGQRAIARVNGQEVDGKYVLKAADRLEFSKKSGTKG